MEKSLRNDDALEISKQTETEKEIRMIVRRFELGYVLDIIQVRKTQEKQKKERQAYKRTDRKSFFSHSHPNIDHSLPSSPKFHFPDNP